MGDALKPIRRLKVFVQTILPLVYDNDLSYLETLAKVVDKMNEIVVNYNELIEYYNTLDGLLEEIQNRLADLDSQIATFIAQIRNEFDQLSQELNTKIDNEVTRLDVRFVQLETNLNNRQTEFEQRIQSQIDSTLANMQSILDAQIKLMRDEIETNSVELKNYLDAELKKFQEMIPEWQNVNVVSPITGKLEPLQKVLNDMYGVMRVEGITAGEYDEMGYTAKEYDKFIVRSIPRGLTVFEYDFYGRRYLYREPRLHMVHPYYGNKVFYKKVIDFNTKLLRESGSFTTAEYDGLLVTAKSYDEKLISAQSYDWLSNRLLP